MNRKPIQRVSVGAAVAAILGSSAFFPHSALGAEEGADALEEVTVTGSRITRRDNESSSPLVTVGAETFEQSGTQAVEAVLNQLPQFVPSQTMFSTGDVQPSAFNNPGIVTLNLRGLGANRNLVLIDGRRAQPANALLVVDINSIPSAAIESVEIISGGASATYGADAMGGVTNFKMKRNFQGLSVNVQQMLTEEGGGEETSVSALVGGNFADGRGNAMLGLSYNHRAALEAGERQWFVNGWLDPNTPGGEGIPFSNVTWLPGNAPTAAGYAAAGIPSATPGETVYINPNGTLFLNSPTNRGVNYTGPLDQEFKRLGPGTIAPGQISANNINALLTTPLERYSVFGNAHFDINDHVTVFAQANFSSMAVDTLLTYAPATSQWNATIPVVTSTGAPASTIPPALATLLASRPNPTAPYGLSRVLDFAGPRESHNKTDMYQVLAGVEGDLFDWGWRYEAYYSHGETSLITEMSGFPGLQNYRAVVQAPNFGRNLVVNSGPPLFFGFTCTSGLPIVSYFDPSQDCVNALSGNMKHLTDMKQDIAEANFNGDLFDLPAGTVGAAFGASWRQNTYAWHPDDQLARNSTNYPIGLFPTTQTEGLTTVRELYAEFLVPVLHEIPGIQQFNLELGARWSDYNTAGQIWTYKALADWTIVDNVRLRGGYQLANRAPNVAELFTGLTTSVVGFAGADPCMANTLNTTWGNHPGNTTNRAQVIQLCSDIINRSRGDVNQSPWHVNPSPGFPNNVVGPFGNIPFQLELANISGNVNLENEEAKTWTVGLVLTSPFEGLFSNASLSIDWYQIQISDAIAAADSWTTYFRCLNGDGTSNPTYDVNNENCRLISRDRDGYRATVDTPYSNLGGVETSGIDVAFNWSFTAGPGRVNINTVFNWLDYFRDQVTPTSPFIDSTGTFRSGGQFDYKTFTTATWMMDNWSAGLRHRFLPSIKSVNAATSATTTVEGAGSYQMLDVFGSFTISEHVQLRGGIDNILDIDPEKVGRNPGTTEATGVTNAQYYDVLGRRYYLAVQLNF